MIKLKWNVYLSRAKYRLNDSDKEYLLNQYSSNLTYDSYFNDRDDEICSSGNRMLRRPIEEALDRLRENGYHFDE